MLEIIKFSTKTCAPCQMLKPVFEQIKQDMRDVQFRDIDAADDHDSTLQYGVRNVPTIIILKNGIEVERFTGARPYSEIVNIINRNK